MNDLLDRIEYTRAFADRIKGRLYARFVLDRGGEPVFDPDPEFPETRHYLIDLYLYSPLAAEIDVVTYHLLVPGFPDPDISSEDEPNDFRAGIQTYGDMQLDVTVNVMSVLYKQRARLSAMLENGHAGELNPAVRDALARIKSR